MSDRLTWEEIMGALERKMPIAFSGIQSQIEYDLCPGDVQDGLPRRDQDCTDIRCAWCWMPYRPDGTDGGAGGSLSGEEDKQP